MFEYPQYEENGQERLFFPNLWRNIQPQTIIGADCFNPNAALNPTENLIVLKLTSSEFTQIYSALYNGAIMTYPDNFMQVLVNFLKGLHCPPIMVDQECYEYPTYASFITYEPENPYLEPDFVPEGYLIPPFQVNGQNGVDYPDYQEFDVITPFGAFEFLGNWFDILDGFLPQITVMVNGIGTVEIKLLTVFNGGMACVTVDAPPNLIDIFGGIVTGADNILDLNLDTFSIPPETAQEVIYEVELTTAGIHTIYITFLPVVDDASIPLRYGGGFRGVQLCNFVEQPDMGIQNIRFDEASCELQTLDDGVWTQVTGWENWLNCVPSGGGGGGGTAMKVSNFSFDVSTTTTTNTTFTTVANIFNLVPVYSKALVIIHNLALVNSAAGVTTEARIVRNTTNVGADAMVATVLGTNGREVNVSDRFEGMTIGVSTSFSVQIRNTAAATATLNGATDLICTVIEYENIEDLFVEDIRIVSEELQKKIGGVWITVTDSLKALFDAVQAQAAAAQVTANNAVSVNATQTGQINGLINVNAQQNIKIAALESFQEDAELELAQLALTVTNHDQRLDVLEYGGVWYQSWDFTASTHGFSLLSGSAWSSNVGFQSGGSEPLEIINSGLFFNLNQISHAKATMRDLTADGIFIQWSFVHTDNPCMAIIGSSAKGGWYRPKNQEVVAAPKFKGVNANNSNNWALLKLDLIGRGVNPFV